MMCCATSGSKKWLRKSMPPDGVLYSLPDGVSALYSRTRREVIELVWLHVMDLALKFAFRLSSEQLVSLFVDYLKAMRITSLIH